MRLVLFYFTLTQVEIGAVLQSEQQLDAVGELLARHLNRFDLARCTVDCVSAGGLQQKFQRKAAAARVVRSPIISCYQGNPRELPSNSRPTRGTSRHVINACLPQDGFLQLSLALSPRQCTKSSTGAASETDMGAFFASSLTSMNAGFNASDSAWCNSAICACSARLLSSGAGSIFAKSNNCSHRCTTAPEPSGNTNATRGLTTAAWLAKRLCSFARSDTRNRCCQPSVWKLCPQFCHFMSRLTAIKWAAWFELQQERSAPPGRFRAWLALKQRSARRSRCRQE